MKKNNKAGLFVFLTLLIVSIIGVLAFAQKLSSVISKMIANGDDDLEDTKLI